MLKRYATAHLVPFCILVTLALVLQGCVGAETPSFPIKTHQDLLNHFEAWRSFEQPPLYEGAPDYRAATFDQRWEEFTSLQKKLWEADTTGWTVPHQVDYLILWAEMNGYAFNHHILKPWARDPAFYKTVWTYRSDVPAHEGPTHHATLELWQYSFPLSPEAKDQMMKELGVIGRLNEQARGNLTGNAADLWIAGIRDIREQAEVLESIKEQPGVADDERLVRALDDAKAATESFAEWLEEESEKKTGSSGLGEAAYTWYQNNVHLVPLTWSDEVMLLQRELTRSWSSLAMEEHRNRNLPPITPAANAEAYQALAERSAASLLTFLAEDSIVSVADYWAPVLDEHLGAFVPAETRHFFWITAHLDPRPLYSHFYHWFELAREDTTPNESSIRAEPLLYNIFDSRNEGMATAVEELFMQAGLYDDDPRVREIVYILIAQRAARGLGSLYAHANQMSMRQAGGIHSEYTPRGWMKTEKELLIFEQHLYLRQPGYGTSYITGKHLVEQTLAEFYRTQESSVDAPPIRAFFDGLSTIGNIPISLGHWELTGSPAQIDPIRRNFEPIESLLNRTTP